MEPTRRRGQGPVRAARQGAGTIDEGSAPFGLPAAIALSVHLGVREGTRKPTLSNHPPGIEVSAETHDPLRTEP